MRRALQALFEAGDAVPGCFDFEVESGKGGGVAAETGFGRARPFVEGGEECSFHSFQLVVEK